MATGNNPSLPESNIRPIPRPNIDLLDRTMMQNLQGDFLSSENHRANFFMNPTQQYRNGFHHENVTNQDLEFAFSGLEISPPVHHNQYHLPLDDYGIQNDSFIGPDSIWSYCYPHANQQAINLQRMRVESAVRGQMNMDSYSQQQQQQQPNVYEGFCDFVMPHDFYNGNQSFLAARNSPNIAGLQGRNQSRFGYQTRSNLNSNFFRRPITGVKRENRNDLLSFMDEIDGELHCHRERANYSSLEEIRGRMMLVTKGKEGSDFLKKKLEEGKPEDVETIFSELINYICDLMVNQFGNYVLEVLFKSCDAEKITEILLAVTRNQETFLNTCLQMHGSQAVQKLLDLLTTQDQILGVISALRPVTLTLSKSLSGNHIVKKCLEKFPLKDVKCIIYEVAKNFPDLAMDRTGCCILQLCVAKLARSGGHREPKLLQRFIDEISKNAVVLAENPYGNYVVQCLLDLKNPSVNAGLAENLAGSIVSLSLSKYASNAVERFIREFEEELSNAIIRELISSPDFVTVLTDSFGNYVAQSALKTSRGALHDILVHRILYHCPILNSHPYGKRVLTTARNCGKNRRERFHK